MIDRSDELRTLDELFQPDPRSGVHSRFYKRTLQAHREEVAGLVLHEGVPRHIRVQFLTSCNVLLYAWFVHRFHHVAELHALATLELALKVRLGAANPEKKPPASLRLLLQSAVDDRLIQASQLREYHRYVAAVVRANEQRRSVRAALDRDAPLDPGTPARAQRPDVELVSEDAIVRQLARMLPQLRNELAHGTTLLYTEGVRRVELCADVINQLFDRPTA